MLLGENIKKFREYKGLTQVQLAERIGVQQSYIAKLEKAVKSPTIMMVKAISKELDCKLEDLIYEDNQDSTIA